MEELINRVAEAKGMPASLVVRSAEARAAQTGASVEEVLREWAGDAPAPTAPAAAEPEAPSPPAVEPPAAAPGAGGPVDAADLLAQAAEARGMPASLVERSAAARAAKEGVAVEAVLAEWAGVEFSGEAAEERAEPEAPSPAPVAADDGEPGAAALAVEVIEPTAAAPSETEPADEVAAEDEEVAGSGRGRYPGWLAAAFVIIPLLAAFYVMAVPNGPSCGSAGQLAVHPASGEAVNCDGSTYGEDHADNFSAGLDIYAARCAACHGQGGGGGAGPALSGGAVLETFPADACSAHIAWVALGSAGWPEATYGAQAKPVAGGMPGFESQLSELELAQVTLYERVAFGGEDLAEAEASCGMTVSDEE